MKEKEKVSLLLIGVLAVFTILLIILTRSIYNIIILSLAWMFAIIGRGYAAREKANPNIAFLIGFFTGLIGLIIYVIFRKMKGWFKKL